MVQMELLQGEIKSIWHANRYLLITLNTMSEYTVLVSCAFISVHDEIVVNCSGVKT
jgi:hypothetical protein